MFSIEEGDSLDAEPEKENQNTSPGNRGIKPPPEHKE